MKDFTYVGMYVYSLCFRARDGTRPFTTATHVRLVLEQILRAARENDMEITAYCFMPDHLHLLVHGLTESADCRAFIRAAKQSYRVPAVIGKADR